jgi:hypothetical protein
MVHKYDIEVKKAAYPFLVSLLLVKQDYITPELSKSIVDIIKCNLLSKYLKNALHQLMKNSKSRQQLTKWTYWPVTR